jgi:glutamate--cysteine ligase
MQQIVDTPDATPSARIITELEVSDTGFFEFAYSMARNHRDYFASITKLNDESSKELRDEAAESLRRQAEIEASDTVGLDEYLADYFA